MMFDFGGIDYVFYMQNLGNDNRPLVKIGDTNITT